MPKRLKPAAPRKQVDSLVHEDAKRRHIPTAEFESVMDKDAQAPVRIAYERRNRDLDPQLVWRGKDEQDWADLVVNAPPLYIQEKVHPKVLIEDLLRESERAAAGGGDEAQLDLFGDFNGLPDEAAKTEFYRHDANWTNRMILGDSLQVMASLAEREGLRGQVQCIYLDPPYGIKFNSNFQWSTTSRDVKDGNVGHITREPEQVKAFRDTWRNGIHSYLTYLRDRLTVARDLLTESGSIFVQIGDENVHRLRALMDEVFGEENCIAEIIVEKTSGASMRYVDRVCDYTLWYGKDTAKTKYRPLFTQKDIKDFLYEYKFYQDEAGYRDKDIRYNESRDKKRIYAIKPLTSQTNASTTKYAYQFRDGIYHSGKRQWATPQASMDRVSKANRIEVRAASIGFVRFFHDFPVVPVPNIWTDTGTGSFTDEKVYVVQSGSKAVARCLLMATDPGDLVLDPTCGSGTTAYVAEQWGRRWITVDTSRVALALARARIMGARYPYYLLADSPEGRQKEAELTRTAPSDAPCHGSIRQGFVYERVPHITLKSIANNAEIDVIWEAFQPKLESLREQLNAALDQNWEEWEIPRNVEAASCRLPSDKKRLEAAATLLTEFWAQRIARQKEIDASIAAKADHEYLYDKPYEDRKRVRVAGPFTVESLSPHRTLGVDEDDELIDPLILAARQESYGEPQQDFATMVLENLRMAGVQQAHKEDRIHFTGLTPWPGEFICAEGRYTEGEGGKEKRAGIFIGPEFGTVARADLVAAAREAGDADFDVLIACAFNYEARTTEFEKLGRIPVLKARMNADLHMADELKNTGAGNLFVIFGEPDIDLINDPDGRIRVKINGVDVFKPQTGKVESGDTDDIACWFVDTDYNEESFFVRHAYFLGANDPYKSLKTTLKAEIDEDAWSTLHSDTSRPFEKPSSGRIAVKVINHLGDEVMKVFRV